MTYSRAADYYDLVYAWKDYAAEAALIRDTVGRRQPAARTLLDVACGTGQHLAHLRAWYEVEGIDAEPRLLEVARGRLPGVPLHEADMRDFDLGRRFDVVTCLFGSIAYLPSVSDLDAAITSMCRHLAPGGLLIIEPFLTPERFEHNHVSRALVGEAPDVRVARMTGHRVESLAPPRIVLEMHYLVARPGTVQHLTEDHALSLFTDDEVRGVLTRAGLDAEHDPEGLMGRGLWIAERR